MSDLERRLRAFPSEFPRPSDEATRRVRERLVPPAPPPPPRRRWSGLAVLAAALAGGLLVGAASIATATDGGATGPDDPTIFARFFTEGPYRVRYHVLSGRVPNAGADEVVEILERTCGTREFRIAKSTRTVVAGFWELPPAPFYGSVVYVARWKERLSDELTLRASLFIVPLPAGTRRWRIRLFSRHQDMRRRVVYLQRRVGDSRWVNIRTARLRQGSSFGAYEALVSVAQRGLTLRAFVPLRTARPCHDAEASVTFRS